jgi:hypothetical protein
MIGRRRVCQVCRLTLEAGDVHRFERDCVQALQLAIARLQERLRTNARAIAARPDY